MFRLVSGCLTSLPAGGSADQGAQIMVKKVADVLNSHVRRRVGGDYLRVVGELALPDEYRGHPVGPGVLDGGQDSQLVVHQNVVLRWVSALDVG